MVVRYSLPSSATTGSSVCSCVIGQRYKSRIFECMAQSSCGWPPVDRLLVYLCGPVDHIGLDCASWSRCSSSHFTQAISVVEACACQAHHVAGRLWASAFRPPPPCTPHKISNNKGKRDRRRITTWRRRTCRLSQRRHESNAGRALKAAPHPKQHARAPTDTGIYHTSCGDRERGDDPTEEGARPR